MNVDDAILTLCAAAGPKSSIEPSSAARAVDNENWRKHMHEVRAVAVRLAKEGRIVILRKGKPVDPDALHGVIRLRIVDAPESNAPES